MHPNSNFYFFKFLNLFFLCLLLPISWGAVVIDRSLFLCVDYHFHFSDFCVHCGYQLGELLLAFLDARSVHVSDDSLAVDIRRVSTFPHVFTHLMDRACSLPPVFPFTRLKFLSWRLLRSCVGVCSTMPCVPLFSSVTPDIAPIARSMRCAAVRIPSSVVCEYTLSVVSTLS